MEEKESKFSLKESLIAAGISLVIGAAIFLIIFFIKGKGLVGAADGSFIAGLSLICVGLLFFISREGFFDLFTYGFKQFGSMFFSSKANRENDFAGYRQNKKNLRDTRSNYYWFICIVGLLYVTAFIIIEICVHNII